MAARHEVTVPMHAVKFLCTSAFHCCLKIATHCCVVVFLCFIGGQPDTIVLFRVFPVPMHMVKCQSHLSLLPQDSICSDLDLAVTLHCPQLGCYWGQTACSDYVHNESPKIQPVVAAASFLISSWKPAIILKDKENKNEKCIEYVSPSNGGNAKFCSTLQHESRGDVSFPHPQLTTHLLNALLLWCQLTKCCMMN